ncbi:MAG: DNA alkylation repair protein [Alkalispirochaetaceae bacterium]
MGSNEQKGSAAAVLADLEAEADPIRAAHSYRYFKCGPGEYGEGDRFLGVTVPKQRRIARRRRDMPLEEAKTLLRDPIHEARLTALFILTLKIKGKRADRQLVDAVARLYLDNTDYVNNWDLVDSSAAEILGPWLEERERSLLDTLAASPSLWENRIAIIATGHFIRRGETADALRIASALASHPHDLIHNGVGWMLREVGDRDRAALESFLSRTPLPRTALRYALEHFSAAERTVWMSALTSGGSR